MKIVVKKFIDDVIVKVKLSNETQNEIPLNGAIKWENVYNFVNLFIKFTFFVSVLDIISSDLINSLL